MNKKGELRGLFHKYIDRKEKESSRPYEHCCGNPYYVGGAQRSDTFREGFNGTIYFYEWSNIYQEPKRYFTIDAFEAFLKLSGIYLALYQKEILKNLKWCYVTCKKGSKDLLIRSSYASLSDALMEDTENTPQHSIGFEAMKPKGSEDKEPYQVAVTHPPHTANNGLGNVKVLQQKVFEANGRWFA